MTHRQYYSNDLLQYDTLADYLDKSNVSLGELDFQCVTESQFNNIELSAFH